MKTPVCDFAASYMLKSPARFHMPGHKGIGSAHMEGLDITEITGADDLFHPTGIIADSEANASRLFGWPTVYSAEGSSLCIRAMLYLAYTMNGCRGAVIAGRNAHKSFINTAILLDFPIRWLWVGEDYLSCPIGPEAVEAAILNEAEKPCAVYITSPDYLGCMADISAISSVCHKHGVPLLVDNAHGAYLKFLNPSLHPMDLGADLCCDSAHKTLPVLTGGAYLHLCDNGLAMQAKDAMALFGSTSPSYLILQSLDRCNPYLETLPLSLDEFIPRAEALKARLIAHGFDTMGDEKLKLTLLPMAFGYTGSQLGAMLEEQGIFCEFQDESHIVFMLSPQNSPEQLSRLEQALLALPRHAPMLPCAYSPIIPEQAMTPRQAAFSIKQTIPVEESAGRILAAASVSCPPAVPIVMCGERINRELIPVLKHHGAELVTVVK